MSKKEIIYGGLALTSAIIGGYLLMPIFHFIVGIIFMIISVIFTSMYIDEVNDKISEEYNDKDVNDKDNNKE